MRAIKKIFQAVAVGGLFISAMTDAAGPFPGSFSNNPVVLRYPDGSPVIQTFVNGSTHDPSKADAPLLLHTTITNCPPWVSKTPFGTAAAVATHASEKNSLYFFEEAVGRLRKVTFNPKTPQTAENVEDIALLPPATYYVAQTNGSPSNCPGAPPTPGTEFQDGRGWSARGFTMNFHTDSRDKKEYLYLVVNQFNTEVNLPPGSPPDLATFQTHGTITSDGSKTNQHGIYRINPKVIADHRNALPWSNLRIYEDERVENIPGEMLYIIWNHRANVAYISITDESGVCFNHQSQTPPCNPQNCRCNAGVASTGKGALLTLNEDGEIIHKWYDPHFDGVDTTVRTGLDGLAFDPNRGDCGVLYLGNFNKGLFLCAKVGIDGIPIVSTLNTVFESVTALNMPADGSVAGLALARSRKSCPAQGLFFCSRVSEHLSTIPDDNLFFLDFTQINIDAIIDGAPGLGKIELKDPALNNIFTLIHQGLPYSSNSNIAFGFGSNQNTLFVSNSSNAYPPRRIISTINKRGLVTDADFTPNICVHRAFDNGSPRKARRVCH